MLRQQRLDARVISVGNLTVGGTGKTPMVLWIAERLLAEGERAGILTRGYRGEAIEGMTDAADGAPSTSDEVQLLRARLGAQVPFGIGADRLTNGRRLVREGVNWLLLDDGFQHLQLARDVDIVLIDATDPFGGGRALPAGRLREPRSALGRAGIIVITRSGHAPAVEALIRRYSPAPIFYAIAQPLTPRLARGNSPGEEDSAARTKTLFAFCGIGNPNAFVSDLQDWGFQIVGRRFYRDHHRYTQDDMQAIERDALAAGAEGLICTEKDLFNLGASRPATLAIRYCPISLEVRDGDRLWQAIKSEAQSRAGQESNG